MIFKKSVKTIQWGKDNLLTNGAGKTQHTQVGNPANAMYKNWLKMDQKPKHMS